MIFQARLQEKLQESCGDAGEATKQNRKVRRVAGKAVGGKVNERENKMEFR
jgi:hypothetical protein